MSYSRWSNSRWYTFWHASSGKTKNTQIFEICDVASFTYKDLKENAQKCVGKVMQMLGRRNIRNKADPITEAEKIELLRYMQAFIEDVEMEFKKGKKK